MRELIDRIFARLGIREAEYLIEGMTQEEVDLAIDEEINDGWY